LPCQNDNATRYGITAAIVVAIVVFILAARHHANRRIQKGLQPLAYHRWLAPRRQMPRPAYAGHPSLFPNAGGWGAAGAQDIQPGRHETDYTEMPSWNYAPPPPAYVPGEGNAGNGGLPGYYQPPPGYNAGGAGKGAPGMTVEEREREQQGRMDAQETGRSTAPVYR